LPMPLIDRFNREISYLRISVTDRCDFRCVYCMAEEMTFLPRSSLLNFQELLSVAKAFVSLGVRKIRITGGEPLIRREILSFLTQLSQIEGLDELVLTTNGAHLVEYSQSLKLAGVKRINISIDTLQSDRFRYLTRFGRLEAVLAGIEHARAVGFERIKLNSVILRGTNDDEINDLVQFASERALDISFIEEMPLGHIYDHSRRETYISSEQILATIKDRFEFECETSLPSQYTDGPSSYYQLKDSKTRVGLISPHSHNFCHLCNRVRLTAEGRLLLCLGNEHSVDLREIIRGDLYQRSDLLERDEILVRAIVEAVAIKPERHYFTHDDEPQLVRFMNMTGG